MVTHTQMVLNGDSGIPHKFPGFCAHIKKITTSLMLENKEEIGKNLDYYILGPNKTSRLTVRLKGMYLFIRIHRFSY